jgi:hypothetical protein
MIGKLHKSEACKQSHPDMPRLQLHPRYSSRDSLSESIELPHSSKLELRNHVGPWRIPTEPPCSSYEEGSRQARRPSGPQSLATFPTRLRLATRLRMRALQVESLNCGVWVNFHHEGGIYRSELDLHRLGEVSLAPGGGRPVGWSGFHHWLRLFLLM